MLTPFTTAHTPSAGCACFWQPVSTIAAAASSNVPRLRLFTESPGLSDAKPEGRVNAPVYASWSQHDTNASGSLLDAPRADAGSAHADMLAHAVNHCANTLQIRIPAAPAGIIRMADHVPETRPFAANLTL